MSAVCFYTILCVIIKLSLRRSCATGISIPFAAFKQRSDFTSHCVHMDAQNRFLFAFQVQKYLGKTAHRIPFLCWVASVIYTILFYSRILMNIFFAMPTGAWYESKAGSSSFHFPRLFWNVDLFIISPILLHNGCEAFIALAKTLDFCCSDPFSSPNPPRAQALM